MFLLIVLGWCLASGVISCALAVANGPVRGGRVDGTLMVKAFGARLVSSVGTVDISRFQQSGRPVEVPGELVAKITVLLGSLLLVVVPALVVWTSFAAEPAEPAEDSTEEALGDLELGFGPHGPHGPHEPHGPHGPHATGAELESAGTSTLTGQFPWLQAHARPDWMRVRQSSRFMTRPMEWSPLFDDAFLGSVEEHEDLAFGFGGTVRAGRLAQLEVVFKQLHNDPDNEALFRELYIGLLVPASPCMGFATAADETLRLVAARLQETVLDYLRRNDLTLALRKQVALGMLSAVQGLANLGLAHCDLKPDNFMTHNGAIFLIDFGSVSQEGDTPPMTCQVYRPDDSVVTLAWDVYSLGQVLLEVFGPSPEMQSLHAQMCCGLASRRPSLQHCMELVSGFHG